YRQLTGLSSQPLQVGNLEVRHADTAGPAALTDLQQRLPGLDVQVLGRYRPVDQVQVHVIQAESLQAGVELPERVVAAHLGAGQFGRYEQVFTGDAARVNGCASALLVAVHRSRVDMPVTEAERRTYRCSHF